ncbi:MAG: energy transducer TonB, partial [Cetobacterium sp.]
YKLGVEDGDVVAKWDQNNREPRYPESAQLRGMQGKVLLKIQIDESGKVSSVFIEKGSGVPEINMAIEEIARTWKIYLAKNGLNIRGTVTLEYSFKLLGAN